MKKKSAPLTKAKQKQILKFKTDIGFIAIILFLISLYSYTKPSLKVINNQIFVDSMRYAYIGDNYLCVEIFVSGNFRNKFIHNGYVNKITIKNNFINPNIPENENYIESKVKYIDKIKIRSLKKTHISASILLYSKSKSSIKDKVFELGFIDNYNKMIEHNSSKEPAILYFSIHERNMKLYPQFNTNKRN